MKRWLTEAAAALILGVVAPAVMIGLTWNARNGDAPAAETTAPAGTEVQAGTQTGAQTGPGETEGPAPLTVPVLLESGQVADIPLDDYLTGVVLGELPEDFEQETRKAQAVVARTYTLRRLERGGKHAPAAAVCTDPACCQRYISPEEYLAAGGDEAVVELAAQAVEDTQDLVLTYEGKLIEATYFSCSGGRTEDALAVWGSDVPYLRATDSPGEESAAHYTDTVQMTVDELSQALGVPLTGLPDAWLGTPSYTSGGGVAEMTIGGRTFTGTDLRRLLDLRSTAFTMTVVGDTVTVTTRGFGHRVGMSQYGADAMAASGSSFEQILAHYYQGAVLMSYLVDKTGDLE